MLYFYVNFNLIFPSWQVSTRLAPPSLSSSRRKGFWENDVWLFVWLIPVIPTATQSVQCHGFQPDNCSGSFSVSQVRLCCVSRCSCVTCASTLGRGWTESDRNQSVYATEDVRSGDSGGEHASFHRSLPALPAWCQPIRCCCCSAKPSLRSITATQEKHSKMEKPLCRGNRSDFTSRGVSCVEFDQQMVTRGWGWWQMEGWSLWVSNASQCIRLLQPVKLRLTSSWPPRTASWLSLCPPAARNLGSRTADRKTPSIVTKWAFLSINQDHC